MVNNFGRGHMGHGPMGHGPSMHGPMGRGPMHGPMMHGPMGGFRPPMGPRPVYRRPVAPIHRSHIFFPVYGPRYDGLGGCGCLLPLLFLLFLFGGRF